MKSVLQDDKAFTDRPVVNLTNVLIFGFLECILEIGSVEDFIKQMKNIDEFNDSYKTQFPVLYKKLKEMGMI